MVAPEKTPLRAVHQIGGLLEHETCRDLVGFPVTICGSTRQPARFLVSSASTCSVVRYDLYCASGLKDTLPYSLTFRPLRPGIDVVRMHSIAAPATELTALALGDCPFECAGKRVSATVFLVDGLNDLVDGILGTDFLREHSVHVAYTFQGQHLTFL